MARKRPEEIRAVLLRHGQDHVLRFWDQLAEPARKHLLRQLESFDLDLLARLAKGDGASQVGVPSLGELEQPEVITLPRTPDEHARRDEARARGLEAMKASRIGVLVVAGGQGSRLGFDGPKGCFPIGPVTNRTLFELHAQKIQAASRRAGRPIPWYIMTSETNDKATREFLRKHKHFGLHPEDVFIFQQGMMPATTPDGRLLLEAPGRVFAAPNGHGGVLSALAASGALDDMSSRGIEHVYYFQVDNPLVPVPDAAFLGYHIQIDAEMSSKVLRKRSAEEPIGTVVRRGGRVEVIEYSDITPEVRDAKDANGELRWPFGSIAIHALSVAFIRRFATGGLQLPFHRASKKVPYVDESGAAKTPEEPNGVKYEMFVFDALRYAERSVTMEVAREDEFAPVKNATGQDSVVTARAGLCSLYARWLDSCGVSGALEGDGSAAGVVEINPLTADSAEVLKAALAPGTQFRDGMVL